MQKDFGLLILRVAVSAMMFFGHGWAKAMNYAEYINSFPDPLGIGSALSLMLATFGEFVCSGLVLIGFKTRLATIPVIITMSVAAFIVHMDDPFARRELALLYGSCFLALFFLGPGKFSIDGRKGKEEDII